MKTYYIIVNTEQQGPLTVEELKAASVTPSTLVWTERMDTWKRADAVDELKSLFNAMPPPLPKEERVAQVFEKGAIMVERGTRWGRRLFFALLTLVTIFGVIAWIISKDPENVYDLIANPPSPQVISQSAAEDKSSSLFEFVLGVDGKIFNSGGEGNVLVTGTLYQDGHTYDKSESAFMREGESRDFHFVFQEADLTAKKTYEVTVKVLE